MFGLGAKPTPSRTRNVVIPARIKKTYYQHNDHVQVTAKSFAYVLGCKTQLLEGISRLLDSLGIGYVISDGNLLEYTRNSFIHHDDDIDIRMDIRGLSKWREYCSNPSNRVNHKYNLRFDDRFTDMQQQEYNGIQCRLIEFSDKHGIAQPDIDVHMDLVFNTVGMNDFWKDYDLDYDKVRRIRYLGVATCAPSEEDSIRLLSQGYGDDFLTPNRPWLGPPLCPVGLRPAG